MSESFSSNLPQKFRPYFTPDELMYLIDLCKRAVPPNQSMIRYLESFALKIKHGTLSPQLALKGSKTSQLVRSLELDSGEQSTKNLLILRGAYEKWSLNPTSCTPEELDLAFSYRASNGLLTQQEEFNLNSKMMENFK